MGLFLMTLMVVIMGAMISVIMIMLCLSFIGGMAVFMLVDMAVAVLVRMAVFFSVMFMGMFVIVLVLM